MKIFPPGRDSKSTFWSPSHASVLAASVPSLDAVLAQIRRSSLTFAVTFRTDGGVIDMWAKLIVWHEGAGVRSIRHDRHGALI